LRVLRRLLAPRRPAAALVVLPEHEVYLPYPPASFAHREGGALRLSGPRESAADDAGPS
jgi:hypothetical protein